MPELPNEVTIDLEAGTAWGMHLGNHLDESPSAAIFLAEEVHAALREVEVWWPSLDSMTVTRDGFATVRRHRDGRTFIYELFPARLGDDQPYEPPVYVGRWPD